MFLLQIILGWFCADLLTAIFHLVIDALANSRARCWPILGDVISDFDLHHHHPSDARFLGDAFGPSTIFLALAGGAFAVLFISFPFFGIPLAVGVALGQAAHRWSHNSSAVGLVKLLQSARILQHPAYHARAHHKNTRRSFGSLNGWSDLILNPILWLVRY